jgi:hypothetical protein
MALLHPIEETFVVTGTREDWAKKCEEALNVTPHFHAVASAGELFRLEAKYRRPPVWGDIRVTLTPEGPASTRITARAMALPNLFTLLFSPERRIIDHFVQAIR